MTFECRYQFGNLLQDDEKIYIFSYGNGGYLIVSFRGNATSVSLNVMVVKLCDRELTGLSKFISLNTFW